MMKDNLQKYTNWRAITESDYFTMFIKTWFAFVATLRELYSAISIFDSTVKPRGARPFTNEYKQEDLSAVANKINLEQFIDIVNSFYIQARAKVASVFPQYFFSTFYRINEDFHLSESEINYDDAAEEGAKKVKDRIHFDLKIVNRFTLSCNIQTNGIYNNTSYSASIKFSLDLKKIIENIDLINKGSVTEIGYIQSFYNSIDEQIKLEADDRIKSQIINKFNQPIVGIIIAKIQYCVNKIVENLSCNYNCAFFKRDAAENSYMILKQRPLLMFHDELSMRAYTMQQLESIRKKIKEDIFLWFIDFVIGLRNALFHEIINPLDEEWQYIFKNAYFALKEILDKTITVLIEKVIAKEIDDKFICDQESELYSQIKEQIESDAFILNNYDVIDDVESSEISIEQINFDERQFYVDKKNVSCELSVSILVKGKAVIFDYDRSVYDKEEDKYFYTVHDNLSFEEAEGIVRFDACFGYDILNLEDSIVLKSLKQLGSRDVQLNVDVDNCQLTPIYRDEYEE